MCRCRFCAHNQSDFRLLADQAGRMRCMLRVDCLSRDRQRNMQRRDTAVRCPYVGCSFRTSMNLLPAASCSEGSVCKQQQHAAGHIRCTDQTNLQKGQLELFTIWQLKFRHAYIFYVRMCSHCAQSAKITGEVTSTLLLQLCLSSTLRDLSR